MPIPSLVPVPVFRRGSSTLGIRPRAFAGAIFSLKVKDGPIGHAQQFVLGDILRVQAWNGSAITSQWLRVDSVTDPGSSAGYYAYGVSRMSGTAGLIPAGAAVVNYGQSGQGFISLSTDGTIGSSPNITLGKHSGTPWTSTTILSRWGNLNGSYGQATNVYGIGIGDYTGGNYLLYDGTTFALYAGGGALSIDGNGAAIAVSTAIADVRSYRFTTASAMSRFGTYAWNDGSTIELDLNASATTGNTNAIDMFLNAQAEATYRARVILLASSSTTRARVSAVADSNGNTYVSSTVKTVIGLDTVPSAMLEVQHNTIGNEVLRLDSASAGDYPTESVYQNYVTTTDATVTTLHSITVPSSTTMLMEAVVSARRTGGSGGAAEDAAGYIVTAVAKGNSGTASLATGSPTTTVIGEDQAGWTATIDVTSNTARVRVTGAVNNNVTWVVTLRTWIISA